MTPRTLLLCAALTGSFALPVFASPGSPTDEFNTAIRSYVALHRQLERTLRPFEVTSNPRDIFEGSDALAAAIVKARTRAREGDLFTATVATFLRTELRHAITAHGYLPEEVIAATREEDDDEAAQPAVNGRFPWLRGAAVWPCLLDALPELPDELQYRLVGRDLVLVDVHANLVVDILRDAV